MFTAHFLRFRRVILSVLLLTFFFPLSFLSLSFADIPQQVIDLQQTAQECINQKDYSCASEIYHQILQDYPDAIWSQCGLARVSILSGDMVAAESETSKLLSNFSDHPDLSKAIRSIADHYLWNQRFTEARSLCQVVTERWPNSPDSIWIQHGLACSAIKLKDYTAANVAVQNLLSDYPDHPDQPKMLRSVIDYYLWDCKYNEVRLLCEEMVKRWPNHAETMWAQHGLACSAIKSKECALADIAVRTLLNDFLEYPSVPSALRSIADYYRWGREYAKAYVLYKRIEDTWPQHPDAVQVRRGLACSAVMIGEFAMAEKAATQVLTDYSEAADMPEVCMEIANHFYEAKQFSKAQPLYQAILDHRPDHPLGIWAQQGLACCAIKLGHYPEAEIETTKLLAAFSNAAVLPKVIQGIAVEYYEEKEYEKSKQHYQYIKEHWSNDPEMPMVKAGIARCFIRLNQDAEASLILDQLDTEYEDHNNFNEAFFSIGEEYYIRAEDGLLIGNKQKAEEDFMHAIAIWQKILAGSVDRPHQERATYYTAIAYKNMERYDLAIPYFEKIVNDWPNYENAWHAQYMCAICSRECEQEGLFSIEKARAAEKRAYEKLLENYPDCPAAEIAQKKLNTM